MATFTRYLSLLGVAGQLQQPLITSPTCCDLLAATHKSLVSFPGTPRYNGENSNYWSTTSILSPTCVFSPTSPAEVASALEILVPQDCEFAVRGGGHNPHVGFNGVDGGVLLSLSNLDEITFADDSVLVGAGNRWIDVYKQTEQRGVTVVGGRLPNVGVSGLLLGGGISWFSNERGWATDNVKAFEIALGNGTLTTASANNNADLFRALKGGSSNFGVVVAFHLYTYPQGPVYGGSYFMNASLQDEFLDLIPTYTNQDAERAPNTHIIPAFFKSASGGPLGSHFASAYLLHNDGPSFHSKTPDLFEPFLKLPALQSTLGVKNMTDVFNELVSPIGFRQGWRTFTLKVDASLLKGIHKIWDEITDSLSPTLQESIICLQPVTKTYLAQGAAMGGNVFGLDAEDGPLILVDVLNQWESESDDAKMEEALDQLFERSVSFAKERGLYHEFLYLNYAPGQHPVIKSYGEENVEYLQDVKARYDPTNVFGRLVQGGHKIPA